MMQRALPLLSPDAPVERREVTIRTPFKGAGARDAFEMVTVPVEGSMSKGVPAGSCGTPRR